MSRKSYRHPKKIRMHSITEKLLVAGLILICVLLIGFTLYTILRSMGKSSLRRHAAEMAAGELSENLNRISETEEESLLELKEGEILIDGEVYAYNEDIMTFLCMGVDSRSGITEEKTPGKGGQADALLLVVANPHTKAIQVIALNRDTMTDIEIYDTDGSYVGTEKKQITLQYAYGDGREKSCELMEKAVSELLYGIPIHGYGALDMASIAVLNDAVGGVEVTLPEDMTWYHPDWKEGVRIHLMGKDALTYVQRRDVKNLGTNLKRIERQKQYLSLYTEKLKAKTKADITFPLSLYNQIQKHMVTSFSVDEITYLATTLLGYEFSTENIINIPGESKMGEKNEEFYIDDGALKEIVVEVFYEKVRKK